MLIAFVAWLGLLVLFRRLQTPVAGPLAALLNWAVASMSAPWVVTAHQHHHVWPLV